MAADLIPSNRETGNLRVLGTVSEIREQHEWLVEKRVMA